jgi:hypothetical protein
MKTPAYLPRVLFFSACLLFSFEESRAQETPASSVPWAYGAYFGTGWYRIDGDREIYVFRYTPRWEYREASFSEDGTRTIGIEFRFPITAGLDNFSYDDLVGSVDPDNLTSLSVTPGIDITIPITEKWQLRPFAAVGWGGTFNNSESVLTYWGGVKSRYSFQHGKLDWALLNSVTYVGHTPSEGPSDDFWPIMAALEFDYPFGNLKLGGEQAILNWYGMYTTFENRLENRLDDDSSVQITDQWEFGISINKEHTPIKIWWFKYDRLGLAYRFSTSGEFKGISFVFRGVFDR